MVAVRPNTVFQASALLWTEMASGAGMDRATWAVNVAPTMLLVVPETTRDVIDTAWFVVGVVHDGVTVKVTV